MKISAQIVESILNSFDNSYSNIKQNALKLIKSGFSEIDIYLKLNEDFDKNMVEIVVNDLRKQGLI